VQGGSGTWEEVLGMGQQGGKDTLLEENEGPGHLKGQREKGDSHSSRKRDCKPSSGNGYGGKNRKVLVNLGD